MTGGRSMEWPPKRTRLPGPRQSPAGCAVVWARTRTRCPECRSLVDWRPGRAGRVWLRQHYRTDTTRLVRCIESFTPVQRDLSRWGVDLPTMTEGCRSLAAVSQSIKRRRGL